MSLAEIKDELAHLLVGERKQIMAYLVGLRIREDESLQEKLSRRADNTNASGWLTVRDLDQRLATLDDE